jgi:Cof subfamily protein (haloacid dehalogenase superfamily)
MGDNMLYVSDLDMTLLNAQAQLSRFAVNNINHFIQQGIQFTVASARSVKSIQPIFAEVDLKLPVIEFNGAFISDLKSGRHLEINAIDAEIVASIHDLLTEQQQNAFLSTFNGHHDHLYYSRISNPGEQWYVLDRIRQKDPRFVNTREISRHFDEQVVCITLIDSRQALEPFAEKLSRFSASIEIHLQDHVYSPGWYWLTIHSHRASKDQAVKKLQKMCGIENTKVTAFGDHINDIKMLHAAHHGVAVENACKDLKKVANVSIGHHSEDSVIRYIAAENNLPLID